MLISSFCILKFPKIFYYYTLVGYLLSMMSMVASVKMVEYSDWQTFALITTEMGHGLNLVITPMFWMFTAPQVYRNLRETYTDFGQESQNGDLHGILLIVAIINIALTDMTLIQKDWKPCLYMGLFYIFVNGFGTEEVVKALYPVVDWQDPSKTVLYLIFMGVLEVSLYYFCTLVFTRILPKRNRNPS